MRKRNDAFYGQDPGTRLSEQARDEIEHGDEGAGHKGNDVDISQRYAQSEADEHTEEAERLTRALERNPAFGIPKDPEARKQYVEEWAERLRHPDGSPKLAQPQEEQEEPFSSEKFWSNPEEVKRAGKAVRPPKL
jgi:hypothetical protein